MKIQVCLSSKQAITLNKLDEMPDLDVKRAKSPYEGSEIGEHGTPFSSVLSAQRFAKFVLLKKGKARILRQQGKYNVYYKDVGSLTYNDMIKSIK